MCARPPVLMSDKKVISVFGEPIELLIASKATNNTFCVAVQTSPPGGGPPPHKHEREEEVFVVLEGEYELFDGKEWKPLQKGEVRYSLRGNYHGFRNSGTTTGRLLFMTNAGGLDEYFAEISPLTLPQDMERFAEISKHYGYYFLPLYPPNTAEN